ncbi:hypothetical protein NG764_03490 [Aliarcobacter cryaerophilus]|uniref:hypothetical protein n=1 Tax=Aliarcobacter cryaerophilus TaxID=28198 RepID=UPI003DA35A5E
MNYIEFDECIVTFGNATLTLLHNGEEVEIFKIPAPFLGEKYRDSINSSLENFRFKNIDYEITINSSNVGTYVIIETDQESKDIDNFTIEINFSDEDYGIDTYLNDKLSINLYVPTLPYTNTTGAVLIDNIIMDKVLPLLDVDTVDKLSSYENDELIDFKHFLDISSIKEVINKEKREEVKKLRKKEKKEHGEHFTKLPLPKEEFIDDESKIEKLSLIKNKNNIIITYKWDFQSNILSIQKFKNELIPNHYQQMAIRVSDMFGFVKNLNEISLLSIDYLILDFNTNFNIDEISNLLNIIKKYNFNNIVYLGAQFNAENISIKEDFTNKNLINNNMPLLIYEELINNNVLENIGYGDYCGFDKKTITTLPSGGRPTSRVVLNCLDSSMKILRRRAWDEQDVTRDPITKQIKKLGNTNSMKKLLCDIKKGDLDIVNNITFLDENLCDADYSLKDFCPDPTSPGVIKTLCFRHNIFSIINNYIKN